MSARRIQEVLRHNLSRSVRFLRQRHKWRQRDPGGRAAISRQMVSRIERGAIETVTVASLHSVASALGATLHVELRWRGEQLDRLIDASHAAVQELMVRALRTAGWGAEVEVSFNWYGDRGRCDAVALHPGTRTLLIVEAKTRLGDVQDLLGRLDIKVRLGRHVARQLGWPEPAHVVPCLVIAEGGTARRIIASHAALFARFTHRGRAAHHWLADPNSEEVVGGLLLFESLPDSHRVSAKRLIRRPKQSGAHSA
jgi:transcriptional regulator with XRE-family HTH domain